MDLLLPACSGAPCRPAAHRDPARPAPIGGGRPRAERGRTPAFAGVLPLHRTSSVRAGSQYWTVTVCVPEAEVAPCTVAVTVLDEPEAQVDEVVKVSVT